MKDIVKKWFFLAFIFFSIVTSSYSRNLSGYDSVQIKKTVAGASNWFEKNDGQFHDQNAVYKLASSKGNVFFYDDKLIYQFVSRNDKRLNVDNISVAFNGLKRSLIYTGEVINTTRLNYFLNFENRDVKAVDVQQSKRLVATNAYDNINILFYSDEEFFKYDFIIKPGGDPGQINISYSGAKKVEVLNNRLIIHCNSGLVEEDIPEAYQIIEGKKIDVGVRYALNGTELKFEVGNYNTNYELVIDPLVYSTYVGGALDELFYWGEIASDPQGNIYATGWTQSNNYPTTVGSYDLSFNGNYDAFVFKLNSTGTSLLFSTYLGSSGADGGRSLIVDQVTNEVVVTGNTTANFPVTPGAYQTTSVNSTGDIFVTKLNANGNAIVYSTLIGGLGEDLPASIALDNSGNPIVIGQSTHGSFPSTAGSFQTTHGGGFDAIVFKLNSSGSALLASTFMGGGLNDRGCALAIGSTGIYVSGITEGSFPTVAGSFDLSYNGGGMDCYVSKLDFDLSMLFFSTYIGGSGSDYFKFSSLKLNALEEPVFVGLGQNQSPTPGVYQSTFGGGVNDVFVGKLNSSGSSLLFLTYIGGSGNDQGFGVDISSNGNIVVTGRAEIGFPTTSCAYKNVCSGSNDAFISVLSPNGSSLIYSTFIGGTNEDHGSAIFENNGAFHVVGQTRSVNFPVTSGAYKEVLSGNSDIFALKLIPSNQASFLAPQSICVNSPVSFQNSSTGSAIYSWNFGDGNTSALENPSHIYNTPGTYTVQLISSGSCGSDTSTSEITITPPPTISLLGNTNICQGSSTVITASGVTSYTWFPVSSLNTSTGSQVIASPSGTTTYTVSGTSGSCSSSTEIVINVEPTPVVNAGLDQPVCPGASVSLSGSGATMYNWSPSTGLSNPSSATTNASPATTTTYTLTGITNNCSGTDVVVVDVVSINVTAGPDLFSCSGEGVMLASSGASSYQWQPDPTLSSLTVSNPYASPAVTSTYTVTGSFSTCTMSDVMVVEVVPKPVVTSSGDQIICEGSSVVISASGASTYSWSPSTGLSNPNASSSTASPVNSMTYTVTGTENGCNDTALVFVDVIAVPLVTDSDKSICEGTGVLISASGVDSYTWSPAPTLSDPSIATPFASPSVTTTYTVTGTINNCARTESVIVNVNLTPVVSAGSASVVCAGDSVQLNASGADQYSWSAASSLSALNISSPLASPSSSYTFTVTGTTNGCSDTATVFVSVVPGVTISSTSAMSCNAEPVTLNASNAMTYSWSPSATLSSSAGQSVMASPTSTTTYTVTGTSSNGCTDTSLSVVVVNQVTVSSSDHNMCDGGRMQLSASGATTYSWSPALSLSSAYGSNVIASPSVTTTYTISGETAGCKAVGFSTVTVHPLPVADFSSSAAEGCPVTCVSFRDQSSISNGWITGWEWNAGNNVVSNTSEPEVCYSEEGQYDVRLIVVSSYGCSDTIVKQAFIKIHPSPHATFTTELFSYSILNPVVCFNNLSTGAHAFEWDFDLTGNTIRSLENNPCSRYADTGIFCVQLTAFNNYECIDTTVHCVRIIEDPVIYFPNSFTPNGDEVNDKFKAVGEGVKEFQLWIFDRWGELIYYSEDVNQGWNGKKNNQGGNVPQDVYVWKARYITDHNRTAKGTVTVIY